MKGGKQGYAVAVMNGHKGPYLSECLERLLPQVEEAEDVFVLTSPDLDVQAGLRTVVVDGDRAQWKNRAFGETDAESVLFVSAFDYPEPGCVAALREAMAKRDTLGIAGALLLTEAGWPRKSHLRRPSLRLDRALMRRVRWTFMPKRYRYMPPRIESARLRLIPAVPSHCALVRRRTWEDAGGFRDGYRFHHEDLLFAEHARSKGWESAIVPPARAYHVPPLQYRTVPASMRLAYERSLRRYVRECHGSSYAGTFAAVRWARALAAAALWGVLSTFENSEAIERAHLARAIVRGRFAEADECPADAEGAYRWEYASWCWT